MKNKLTIELNDLLTTVIEVKDGYEQSAKDIKSEETKAVFREIADQKIKDALEIKSILETFDSTISNLNDISNERTGGAKALQSLFTDKGEKSIIEHCIIDEKSLAEKYKSILSKDDAEKSIKTILRQQLARSYDHNTSLWEQSVKFKSFTI